MAFFDVHQDGCSPRTPCIRCRLARVIEENLNPSSCNNFFELAELVESFDRHIEGCTPIDPCEACQALNLLTQPGLLKSSVKTVPYSDFLSILKKSIDATTTTLTHGSPIETLGIRGSTQQCLIDAGITTIGLLLALDEDALVATLKSRNLRRFNLVKKQVAHYGFEFKPPEVILEAEDETIAAMQ